MNIITNFLCLSLSLLLLGATALGMNIREGGLFEAAQDGNLEVLEKLIVQGASVNAKNNYGLTPLLYASANGHDAVCEFLIMKGALIEAKNNDEQTPLIFSAGLGRAAVCRLLIDKKAFLEAKDNNGQTPLSWAAQSGHGDLCKLLIANKAMLDSKDGAGRTPLMHAFRYGRENVCKFLIDVQLEQARKGNAAIVTLLGIAKNKRSEFSYYMPYDVARIIASHAFVMIQQSKRPVIDQINWIGRKEERDSWLVYAKQQMNTPIVYVQDANDNQAQNDMPADDIEEPGFLENCTLQ